MEKCIRTVTVAASQMPCSWDKQQNVSNAIALVRQAAQKGAQIVLLQELFEYPYFCIEIKESHLQLATTLEQNDTVKQLQSLAKELQVVIPFSWFERAGNCRFNSIAIIDATGEILGVYRKAHIPDSDGYLEKYYFSPGDSGFKVWQTKYAKIGVGICWDQWFPEAARAMALKGADILLYPTAIGSEPSQPELNSQPHWQRVMQGHAAANMVPVVASNRIGNEQGIDRDIQLSFFGHSFICDETGKTVAHMNGTDTGVLTHTFDLDKIEFQRHAWGLFRDRRPELYGCLNSLDGK